MTPLAEPRLSSRAAPRVLILGDRPVVALAACRALGRAGYDVGVTGWRRREIAGVSRYAARYHRLARTDGPAEAWRTALCALVADTGYDAVVASSDGGLARLMGIGLPVASVPAMSDRHLPLIDKGRLAHLCQELGIPYPRTWRSAGADDDERLARSVKGPVIVKAVRSAIATPDHVVAVPGAAVVDDGLSAAREMTALRRRGAEPILQAQVAGEKFQAMIIRRAGATTFRLAFRVVREYPPRRGSESMLEAISAARGLGSRLVATLERVADATGYEGFVQAEFVGTGERPYLIDVNPRLTGSLPFAELLGLRATERAVRDALGHAPPPMPPDPTGRRYHHLVRELAWIRSRPGAARAVLRTVSRSDVWDVPSPTDPLPDLLRLAWVLRRSLTTRARW